MHKNILRIALVSTLALGLAGCKTSEELAEERYQAGLALLEAGDPDRARIEFRNVFELNGGHKEARTRMAEMFLADGNTQGAYRQYLIIVEFFPEDLEGRIKLAELAFANRDWEELARHSVAAAELSPDDPRVIITSLGSSYREVMFAGELTKADALALEAQALLESDSDNIILRNIVIDAAVRAGDYDTAISNINVLIAASPEEKPLYDQRLALIAQTGNVEAIEEELLLMTERFSDDVNARASLLRFYVARQEMDKAEDFLRGLADPAAEDPGPMLDLIRFVGETKGLPAAKVELDRAIAASPDPAPFRALRAGLDFSSGNQDVAIAELEDVLETAEPSDSTDRVKVALARMLIVQENEVGARRLIGEVLETNSTQADALKIQAAWQIDGDDTEGAIANLRTAIDRNPDDAEAMTLMSEAYERAGNPDLTREFLALAFDASGSAPTESLRYARLLIDDERYLPAEDVLITALRLEPNNTDILTLMGELYIAMKDEPRTQQVIDALRRQDDPNTSRTANALAAELVRSLRGTEEALQLLQQLTDSQGGDVSGQLVIVRTKLATGDTEGARALMDTLLAANPTNTRLRIFSAAIKNLSGDITSAISEYTDLLVENPKIPQLWLELSRAHASGGDAQLASLAIENGLEQNPGDPNLLWALASIAERDGDYEGAIAIYEDLYKNFSDSSVIANNLASLISTYRDDEESLERAYIIARRLRGTENPAEQDTFGWIAFRRGDPEEALPYLEGAAAGLPDDVLTQFHLGMVYSALGEKEKAINQLQRMLALAGPLDTRAQIEVARQEIAKLQAE